MEKQEDYTLMKARSYRGVIATGLRFYTSSFRKTFKATWLYTLPFAVVAAIIGALLTTRLLPVGLQMIAMPEYKWLIAQEHMPLMLIVGLLCLVELALLAFICRATGRKLSMFHSLRRAMKAAARHWLLSLAIILISMLVFLPVCLLLGLPVIILTTAGIQAHIGTLMGDPLGLPSTTAWLAGCTWLLTAFLLVYILISTLFVGYYAYGSAETQQREKQKLDIQ